MLEVARAIDLLDSLTALELHFLRRFPYPILIFHEGLNPEEMEQLRHIYSNLLFHRLDRSFLFPPDHIDQSKVLSPYLSRSRSRSLSLSHTHTHSLSLALS